MILTGPAALHSGLVLLFTNGWNESYELELRTGTLELLKQERPKWKTALLSMGMSKGEEEINSALTRIERALVNVFQRFNGKVATE